MCPEKMMLAPDVLLLLFLRRLNNLEMLWMFRAKLAAFSYSNKKKKKIHRIPHTLQDEQYIAHASKIITDVCISMRTSAFLKAHLIFSLKLQFLRHFPHSYFYIFSLNHF